MHVQTGEWLRALHKALKPQEPGQGSLHLSLTHARFEGHSELDMHSGLQFGGLPTKFCTHEHTGWLFVSRQTELGPQGEGMQGCSGSRKIGFSVKLKG